LKEVAYVYFLIALIVAVSLFLAIRTWRGYEVAYRSGPNGEETIDVSSTEPFIIPSGDGFNTSVASHPPTDCGPSHQGVCDSGHDFTDIGHIGGHH
jgi:hypothetical protein